MTAPGELAPVQTRHVIEHRDAADADPRRLLAALARTILEVEVGRRPLWQLEGVVSPALLTRLAVRDDEVRREARRRRRPLVGPGARVVRTVVAQQPTPDVCEGSVIVDYGSRVLPLAMRAERYRGSWRVVAIDRPHEVERGPDGPQAARR